ncbi:hypothetical protein BN938_0415 [Mucinivorans hirudinis]|uniref:Uncharacterized protein n=1 Tax=Mucinivorans hirudinis TaxID=1433126 RepID=A0A060R6C7_9BACT|nr:hypothetical protein BN938_0415 [Mucinivorans hirudinis]
MLNFIHDDLALYFLYTDNKSKLRAIVPPLEKREHRLQLIFVYDH